MRRTPLLTTLACVAAAGLLAACAGLPSARALDAQFQSLLKGSFRAEGIAGLDRLEQDASLQACSAEQPPSDTEARRIEAEAQATIAPPPAGRYLGDWREGEKLAQSGRGLTWTDKSADPAANGASCYNCHQLSKAEIAFGTIGPSLYQYGRLRGVTDPDSPAARPIIEYTWGKLWNARAYNACSHMPRAGHLGILSEAQIRHVMALLLDPKSPVNQ